MSDTAVSARRVSKAPLVAEAHVDDFGHTWVAEALWMTTITGAIAAVMTLIVWWVNGRHDGSFTWLGLAGTWWALFFAVLIASYVRRTFVSSGRLESTTDRILAAVERDDTTSPESGGSNPGPAGTGPITPDNDSAGSIEDHQQLRPRRSSRSPWVRSSISDAPDPVQQAILADSGYLDQFYGISEDSAENVYRDFDRDRWFIARMDRSGYQYWVRVVAASGQRVWAKDFLVRDFDIEDLLFLL